MIRSPEHTGARPLPHGSPGQRHRPWLLLALLMLTLLTACGRANFTPQGWSGMALGESEAGDVLYVASGEGKLLAVSLPEERLLWAYPEGDQPPLGPVYSPPAVTPQMLYLATGNDNRDRDDRKSDRGVLYGFNRQICADNPQQCVHSWSFPDSGFSHKVGSFVGGPVAEGETVVAGSSDGSIYAVSAAEGDFLWEFPTGDKIWSTPTVSRGIVYIGSLNHTIYAISLTDGREAWRFETGGAITGTPLVVDGRLYVGSFDGNLYVLDTDSGQELARIPLGGWIWAGPVADATNSTIYVSTLGETFYALERRALDRGAKQERWPPVATSGPVLAPPVILGDQILFTDDKGLRIVRQDGRVGRRDPCSTLSKRVRAALVVYQNLVYVIDGDREVQTVDPETCRPVPISELSSQ